ACGLDARDRCRRVLATETTQESTGLLLFRGRVSGGLLRWWRPLFRARRYGPHRRGLPLRGRSGRAPRIGVRGRLLRLGAGCPRVRGCLGRGRRRGGPRFGGPTSTRGTPPVLWLARRRLCRGRGSLRLWRVRRGPWREQA